MLSCAHHPLHYNPKPLVTPPISYLVVSGAVLNKLRAPIGRFTVDEQVP
jgi:hypothetical protein